MRGQISAWCTQCETARTFVRMKEVTPFTDEIEGPLHLYAVDEDRDPIAVSDFANGSSRERLWSNVTNTGPGGDAREARISQKRDVLSERQRLQRGRDLVRFLHSRAHRSNTREDEHIASLDLSRADCRDG